MIPSHQNLGLAVSGPFTLPSLSVTMKMAGQSGLPDHGAIVLTGLEVIAFTVALSLDDLANEGRPDWPMPFRPPPIP